MPFHRFLQEFKRRFTIERLGDDAFKHLAFVINRAPKEVRDPVDLHVEAIHVPLPVLLI